jgi:hypothetical protein
MDAGERHSGSVAVGMVGPTEAAWLPKAMPPISKPCSGDEAHLFVRGLTLCHFDATLRQHEPAQHLLADKVAAELATRGTAGTVHQP